MISIQSTQLFMQVGQVALRSFYAGYHFRKVRLVVCFFEIILEDVKLLSIVRLDSAEQGGLGNTFILGDATGALIAIGTQFWKRIESHPEKAALNAIRGCRAGVVTTLRGPDELVDIVVLHEFGSRAAGYLHFRLHQLTRFSLDCADQVVLGNTFM